MSIHASELARIKPRGNSTYQALTALGKLKSLLRPLCGQEVHSVRDMIRYKAACYGSNSFGYETAISLRESARRTSIQENPFHVEGVFGNFILCV